MQPEFELATSDMIVQFTLKNLGIGSVVRDFAEKFITSGELFELKFRKQIPARNLIVITSDKNPISTAARELLNMMK